MALSFLHWQDLPSLSLILPLIISINLDIAFFSQCFIIHYCIHLLQCSNYPRFDQWGDPLIWLLCSWDILFFFFLTFWCYNKMYQAHLLPAVSNSSICHFNEPWCIMVGNVVRDQEVLDTRGSCQGDFVLGSPRKIQEIYVCSFIHILTNIHIYSYIYNIYMLVYIFFKSWVHTNTSVSNCKLYPLNFFLPSPIPYLYRHTLELLWVQTQTTAIREI